MVTSKLSKQIAVYTTLFIFFIEGIVFVFSYYGKERELREIHRTLEEDVISKTGKHFDELHPGILDDADIQKRLYLFSKNILFLVIIISTVTSFGVIIVFRLIAGKYISQVIRSNREVGDKLEKKDLVKLNYKVNNEIDELIDTRNLMIEKIISYQEDIENEIKKLESQIIQSAKLSTIGEMTSSIIHDLKNPLMSLELNFQQLNKDTDFNNKKSENINKSISKIKILIERMGKYSRLSHFEMRSIDVAMILKDSIAFLEPKTKKYNAKIDLNILRNSRIIGDTTSLQQVFSNLLSNALDAIENCERKEIIITTIQELDKVKIEISDTGIGMNDETLQSIFQSFYTTKPIGKGTGLGLSSVQRILKEHNAEIKVESEINKGSKFTIFFKAAS